ncbi:hypothetical protein HHK36_017260 [Tetracentron sinense]|uniref:Uncharacterized protein n=1 Tax=Tetracentron sinense TaxID=13715 RepID=A0A834Z4Y1_TETSI|nr:hypothetical protein HHK36_017260 [Tetracentron sinense]
MDVSTSSQSIGSKANVFWGWIFLGFGSVSFLGFFYAAFVSKLLPTSENRIISAIQNDSRLYAAEALVHNAPYHINFLLLPWWSISSFERNIHRKLEFLPSNREGCKISSYGLESNCRVKNTTSTSVEAQLNRFAEGTTASWCP